MSAHVKAAEEFFETLDKLMVEENSLPEQIFDMGETSLVWKGAPENTFICKEAKSMPGSEAFKDRIAVLLRGNITGYKLKPLVTWHSENPRALSLLMSSHYRYTTGAKNMRTKCTRGQGHTQGCEGTMQVRPFTLNFSSFVTILLHFWKTAA